MPRRTPEERLSGRRSAGSRQSRRGSRRPESHSKVEEVMRKDARNQSGLRGGGFGDSPPWRLRLRERRVAVAAVCWENKKWWIKGKVESAELGLGLELESVELGGKMRRRRRMS